VVVAEGVAHARQDAGGDVGEVLAGTHEVEIDLGGDAEDRQHLIEHLPVLGGDADADGEVVRRLAELGDERSHLDGFGPGAEDEQQFERTAHSSSPPSRKLSSKFS
jgi:hypothetical protein